VCRVTYRGFKSLILRQFSAKLILKCDFESREIK